MSTPRLTNREVRRRLAENFGALLAEVRELRVRVADLEALAGDDEARAPLTRRPEAIERPESGA